MRNFLLKSYKNLKAASPATPILIREAGGVQGGLVARYGAPRASPTRASLSDEAHTKRTQ